MLAAAALFQPLVWDSLYAAGAALKRQQQQQQKKPKIKQKTELHHRYYLPKQEEGYPEL